MINDPAAEGFPGGVWGNFFPLTPANIHSPTRPYTLRTDQVSDKFGASTMNTQSVDVSDDAFTLSVL
ncbi:MAG: hypothetical protein QOC89_1439 [Paraburkholderia sp.]|nr:hypothetical protein [Paraburkholderia sp.]